MVTIENYEEYLMLAADGELDAAGKEALDAFLERHPELASEATAWQALRMQPDEQIVFAEKETLLRREPKRIALNWKVYALGAAASLLFAALLLPRLWRHEVPWVAHHLPASVPPPGATVDSNMHLATSVPAQQALLPAPHQTTAKKTANRLPGETHAAPGTEALAALPIIENKSVDVGPLQSASLALREEAPQVVIGTVAEGLDHKPVLPRFQFAVPNQPAIELFRQGFEERAAQVASLAQTIKETALVVRLGNGTVNLNF